MLNKDHLLKIRRILSAQDGTQVPKPQSSSGEIISYDLWKKIPGNENKSRIEYYEELSKLNPESSDQTQLEMTNPAQDLVKNTETSTTISKNIQTPQQQEQKQETLGPVVDQFKPFLKSNPGEAAKKAKEQEEKPVPWQDKDKGINAYTNSTSNVQVPNTVEDPSAKLTEAASKTSSLDDPKLQSNVDQKEEQEEKAPLPQDIIISSATKGLKNVQQSLKDNPNGSTVSKITGAVQGFISPFLDKLPKDQQQTTNAPTTHTEQDTINQSSGKSELMSNPASAENTYIEDVNRKKDAAQAQHNKSQITNTLQQDLNPIKRQNGEAGGINSSTKQTNLDKTKFSDLTGIQKANRIGEVGGKWGSLAGTAIDTVSSLVIDKSEYADDSWTNSESRNTYDTVSNSLMSMGGYGAMAGAAMKAVGLINDLGGSKSIDFSKDEATIEQVGGSYGGTVDTINEAASKAGKKYGLFESGARHDANNLIRDARRKQSTMAGIAQTAKEQSDAATYSHDNNVRNYQYQINGGYDQRFMRAAKEGGNIEYFKDPFKVSLSDVNEFKVELSDTPTLFKAGGTLLDKLDKDVFKVILTDVPELSSFKQGGTIKDREIEVIETDTTQKSVIPEGVLHKNKHHLDKVGVDDSELTKKGIPVVDNQGEQQAEIELNEIIFTLEVTKELESRYKEFYEEGTSSAKKDELAIEAGKLLWKEILYNTDDRTGLIDTLKQGGTLKQPKPSEVSKHKQGGTINNIDQDEITKMVKQALINILTNNG